MNRSGFLLSALMALVLTSCVMMAPIDPVGLKAQVSVPTDVGQLDAWLAEQESQFPMLKPGVAKGIVWADSAQKKPTPVSIVYLHGYTASRGEMAPAVDQIGKQLGANVFYTRYTGHGLGPQGHRNVTVQDWLKDTLQAVEIGHRLGSKVIVIACSTGGTLAAWLALSPFADQIAAYVLVSPNFTPKDSMANLLLWPGNDAIRALVVGDTMTNRAENPLHAQYWDLVHDSHSLFPMMQIVDVVRNSDFHQWKTPVEVFYNPDDVVVNDAVTVEKFAQVPATLKTMRLVASQAGADNHVLAGDARSPAFTPIFVTEAVTYLRSLGL